MRFGSKRLLTRVQEGDTDALALLVDRHGDRCLRVAAEIAGPDVAEDVAFHTFLSLWRQPPTRRVRLGRWLTETTRAMACAWSQSPGGSRNHPGDPATMG